MTYRPLHLAASTLPLVALLSASSASAFCRTTTCELDAETQHGCAQDENGCSAEGTYLKWKDPCLSYALDSVGAESLGVTLETYQSAVADAFARWKDVTCPGGGHPHFEATLRGIQECQAPSTTCGDQHQNTSVIMIQADGWPMTYAAQAIGLTLVSADLESGEIIDADMELNASGFKLTWESKDGSTQAATDPLAYQADMVLTHELGHFLGLSHSQVTGSIMAVNYQNQEHAGMGTDDIEAICSIFPPSDEPLSCAAPEAPAASCQVSAEQLSCTNVGTSKEPGGCSLGGAPGGARSLWWIVGVGGIALACRRRSYCHDSQHGRG